MLMRSPNPPIARLFAHITKHSQQNRLRPQLRLTINTWYATPRLGRLLRDVRHVRELFALCDCGKQNHSGFYLLCLHYLRRMMAWINLNLFNIFDCNLFLNHIRRMSTFFFHTVNFGVVFTRGTLYFALHIERMAVVRLREGARSV